MGVWRAGPFSVPFSVLPTETFAQRLRKARIEAGLTQKQLSRAAGLSKDFGMALGDGEAWGSSAKPEPG